MSMCTAYEIGRRPAEHYVKNRDGPHISRAYCAQSTPGELDHGIHLHHPAARALMALFAGLRLVRPPQRAPGAECERLPGRPHLRRCAAYLLDGERVAG